MTLLTDEELRGNRVSKTIERQMGQFVERAKREAQRLPHRFISIGERQWRAGKKRHLCAECDLDYSDPIHIA